MFKYQLERKFYSPDDDKITPIDGGYPGGLEPLPADPEDENNNNQGTSQTSYDIIINPNSNTILPEMTISNTTFQNGATVNISADSYLKKYVDKKINVTFDGKIYKPVVYYTELGDGFYFIGEIDYGNGNPMFKNYPFFVAFGNMNNVGPSAAVFYFKNNN